jgi:hypothetical protein
LCAVVVGFFLCNLTNKIYFLNNNSFNMKKKNSKRRRRRGKLNEDDPKEKSIVYNLFLALYFSKLYEF